MWGVFFILLGIVYRLNRYKKYKIREANFIEQHPIVEKLMSKEKKTEYCVCDLFAFATIITLLLYALGILFTHIFIPKPQKMDLSNKVEKVEAYFSNSEKVIINESTPN